MEFMHFLLYLGVLFTFIDINNSNSDVSRKKLSSHSLHHHHQNDEIDRADIESSDDNIHKRQNQNHNHHIHNSNNSNHKLGWSTWSDFSACSRTCDGGVAFQLRRCHSSSGCRGESVRHKICNMQACPDQQDFRAQQCAAFNDVPYDGAMFSWTPHYDDAEPCALLCRGRPANIREKQIDESDEDPEDTSVIVQLTKRVKDGTRCRPGSLDMCIQGRCQRVGCDLRVGSTKKIDSCGVCGGDGSNCTQPLYHWEVSEMSVCSVTCGGGYKMSVPTCRNRLNGADVEESLCNAARRPEPIVAQCNTHTCPPKWISDEWGACSKVCGVGMRERLVVCAEESNGARHRVPNDACGSNRPKVQEPCNTHECPKWQVSDWSGCSSSCGSGMQIRSVECVDNHGSMNTQCDPDSRPPSMQECSTGISCTSESPSTTEFNDDAISTSEMSANEANLNKADDDDDDAIEDDINTQQKTSKTLITKSREHDEDLDSDDDEDEEDSEMQGDEPAVDNDTDDFERQQRIRLTHLFRQRRTDRLVDPNAPNEPTFIAGDWSPCSVTCGEGIRVRKYECKIFLEFSKIIATIDDSKCHGRMKPADDFERCFMEPCSYAYGRYENRDRLNNDQIKVQPATPGKSYIWRDEGYTSCSASCLGGVEELIINCVREDTGKVVSPYLCSPETKPENRIRTCNDIPCPPRWNYSDYSQCTKSCGIGIKTREINCIHEVTRGGENTMIVPSSMCPQPPPPDRQYCNVLDCPARWEVGEWSRCTKSCGSGNKNRTVLCKQTMAQDHKVGRLDSMCPGVKPMETKPCNTKPCDPEDDRPHISTTASRYIQHDPNQKTISLKVGGAATIFYGTQVKIKCPVKKYNRTKIKWSKDHNFLPKTRKYKVSKKGALRILDVTFKDGGVYTCHAGQSVADITLTIKAKPGESPTTNTEESEGKYLAGGKLSGDAIVHGRNSSGRTRTRQRPRQRQRDPSSVKSGDGRPSQDEDTLQSHSQMTHLDSSSLSPTTSAGTRNRPLLPHFEHLLASLQFLWPFQSYSHSKGHQKLMEQHLKYTMGDHGERAEQDDPQALNLHSPKVIEKSLSDSIDFEYYVRPWSHCSQTCGSNDSGYRLRTVHCMVRVKNTTKIVDNILCEDAGLKEPESIEKCGNVECPRWSTGEWSICQKSKCFAWHTALQKRDVKCVFGNDSITDKCDENEKPTTKQECYNELCKGVWRVEQWSECNAPCNGKGTRYRLLHCVWYGTRKPAGNACNNQPRPAVMKTCSGPPCIDDPKDCKDISKYCNNVKTMGLCRLHRFHEQCCSTCKFNVYT